MHLKLKLKSGDVQEIQVQELLEVDGVQFNSFNKVETGNIEDRLRLVEMHIVTLMNFLDEKFPQPSPQNEKDN